MTTSLLFKKGKINWQNFSTNPDVGAEDSPRGLVSKSNSVTNKLRKSLIKHKLEKLDALTNPLEAYHTIDGGV